ncbi:hypothetical protein SLEP1_g714 [Rubroshorea leprosula]|uniref:HIT-type domain-containing protein n=1 Tax=Rubroshorea leprosula TaxID=152421 RepID=A0AAV5HKV7_9ROSI|nr:hypothetical protein SLEP1_g714 [Rubroshorea leprosula]
MGGSSWQCQVCNEAQSKYKCPCLIPYCSLPCYNLQESLRKPLR